eukprot:12225322-Alexandrium_andersonii.AAC.1
MTEDAKVQNGGGFCDARADGDVACVCVCVKESTKWMRPRWNAPNGPVIVYASDEPIPSFPFPTGASARRPEPHRTR